MGTSPDVDRASDEPVESLPEARDRTRSRLHDLRRLIARYARRHFTPAASPRPRTQKASPPMAGMHAVALRFLRWTPFLLIAGFIISFIWDFPGRELTLAGYTLQFEGLLRTLSVSGLIGFGTNWLAITMLFQPRERRPIFGQGLLPAQRERIAHRLAAAISRELVNEHTIAETIQESRIIEAYRDTAMHVIRGVLEDPAFRRDVKALTADYVESVLRSPAVRDKLIDVTLDKIEQHASRSIAGIALKAYRFFREDELVKEIDQAIQELPDTLDTLMDELDHVLDRMPETLERRGEDIEQVATRVVLHFVQQIDIEGMMFNNLRRYDEQKLERILKNTSNEQLNYIKYLGGVLGCVGGLVIWEPLPALIGLGSIGLALYLIDEGLYRLKIED